jgi:hypothetical protein
LRNTTVREPNIVWIKLKRPAGSAEIVLAVCSLSSLTESKSNLSARTDHHHRAGGKCFDECAPVQHFRLLDRLAQLRGSQRTARHVRQD